MTVFIRWNTPPTDLVWLNHEVHLWCASLNQSQARLQQLTHILSEDERVRVEQFHFDKDKKHFIAGRGLLRTILGRYLNLHPVDVQLCYGSSGKPALAPRQSKSLQFNLSHSQELGLYAFTLGRSIGVDLEYLRPVRDMEQIVERFFSVTEQAAFDQLPASQKCLAFFQGWTCKEAYLKAIGDGLTQPLHYVEVALAPSTAAKLLNVADHQQAIDQWLLKVFQPTDGYIAAVAVEGEIGQIQYWWAA